MNPNLPQLTLSKTDFERLMRLIQTAQPEIAEPLEFELQRATLVDATELPANVVSMNSIVRFKDVDSNTESTLKLVYPHEASMERQQISVLAPIGSALIGMKIGDAITWSVPSGKEKRITVMEVSQPRE